MAQEARAKVQHDQGDTVTTFDKIDTFCKKHYTFAWSWFVADIVLDILIKPLWKVVFP
jgi:hypothetical protein